MKSLTLVLIAGIFSTGLLVEPPNRQASLVRLERSLRQTASLVKLDNARRQARRKVLHIISRFNPNMDAGLKQRIADEIFEMSLKYANLDVDLLCATITHESGRTWDPRVVSKAGALGLMQIMPATGRWLARYEGMDFSDPEAVLFDPICNIRLGARYLSALIETYDLEGGLAAYNGGGRRAAMWLAHNKADGILWQETRDYVPHVLKLYDEFKGTM